MDLDEAAARLTSLILDDADIRLAVQDLAQSAVGAVPSCVAILITRTGTTPLAVVTSRYRTGMERARSTMRIDFAADPDGTSRHVAHRMVFVAEEPAAFAGFADFAQSEPSDSGPPVSLSASHRLVRVGIDEDLTLDTGDLSEPEGPPALDRTINHAIGFLIDRGFEPGEALHELHARATEGGTPWRRPLTVCSPTWSGMSTRDGGAPGSCRRPEQAVLTGRAVLRAGSKAFHQQSAGEPVLLQDPTVSFAVDLVG